MTACPWCGEPVSIFVDPGGGEAQSFVEDCSVCCRPIRLHARRDPDDPVEFLIDAERDE
ncbi:MAG: CPXCG motif-containing cysteine-rich protein [Polyangiaceae bacterium]|nr:CPXCG motif-containing cysteine-rich protein [Polyangiaceae bacterium]